MALSISGGDGSITSQAKTQTPQASVAPATNAAPGGRVQSGTASSLLTTHSGGISLTPKQLPTVTISAASTPDQSVKPATPPATHHMSPVLIVLVVVLLLAAILTARFISRSAKTTTTK